MDFELPDTRRVQFLTLAMILSIITLIDISFPYNSLPSHNPVICCVGTQNYSATADQSSSLLFLIYVSRSSARDRLPRIRPRVCRLRPHQQDLVRCSLYTCLWLL